VIVNRAREIHNVFEYEHDHETRARFLTHYSNTPPLHYSSLASSVELKLEQCNKRR
jgi:hypothetical protein